MSATGYIKGQLTKAANALRLKKSAVDVSILDRLDPTEDPDKTQHVPHYIFNLTISTDDEECDDGEDVFYVNSARLMEEPDQSCTTAHTPNDSHPSARLMVFTSRYKTSTDNRSILNCGPVKPSLLSQEVTVLAKKPRLYEPPEKKVPLMLTS
ncbi:hypothetical protein Y032_0307g2027 [Ancylostoma ceylanicum]|uniref:Uncharacterized protein n=1 Tax=Ancylostoma ceylanicum TaxID=53326 RepID=A0A016S3M0_9BILA|nr:hypothetical protein Y032_0307g2027 [Ancylostoma ceylanicum]